MKQRLKLSIIILLLAATSCHAQKLIQKVSDTKKLENNKEQFIGKPLKVLLDQIAPKIKSAIGNPDNVSKEQTTTIIFYFVEKKEFVSRDKRKEKPTRIGVVLQKTLNKNYPPLLGSNPWTEEQEREYGDMTVIRIWVNGEN